MRVVIATAATGWALLTAGVAALTSPWAWALSGGIALLAVSALLLWDEILAAREEDEGGDR